MDSIKVLLTQRFSEPQLERIRAVSPSLNVIQRSVKDDSDRTDSKKFFDGDEEILYTSMPPHDLSVAPRLKWVQLHSAGINHLADHPILQTNIRITTSSGIHATPIGEFAITLMLALARRVPRLVHLQKRAEWPMHRWRLLLGTELRGKTLGIIGYGSIGRETARIAKQGFGMRVLALTRSDERNDHGYHEAGIGDPDGTLPDAWFKADQLIAVLAQADFVLVATPLTAGTRNLIGERELHMMKPTAFIINIARGGIIDQAALIHALKEKWIAGAGLDVFDPEPLPADSELWKLENALLAPHISGATPHYDDRAIDLFCENLQRYLRGEALLNEVNREKGY